MNREERLTAGVVSARIRWLAVLAGCFSVIFGAPAFGAPLLVLGTVLQPRAPSSGRWLMWLGAFLLSLTVVPSGPGVTLEAARNLTAHDPWTLVKFGLFLASTVSVVLCDLALVREAVVSGRRQAVRGSLDWIVWIVALALSFWIACTSPGALYSYRNHRLLDVLIFTGCAAVVLLFDVGLIVGAVRTRRG